MYIHDPPTCGTRSFHSRFSAQRSSQRLLNASAAISTALPSSKYTLPPSSSTAKPKAAVSRTEVASCLLKKRVQSVSVKYQLITNQPAPTVALQGFQSGPAIGQEDEIQKHDVMLTSNGPPKGGQVSSSHWRQILLFQNKNIRDLASVIACPPLLQTSIELPLVPDDVFGAHGERWQRNLEWLSALDADDMDDWFGAKRRTRLGYHFADCVEYLLRFSPSFRPRGLRVSEQVFQRQGNNVSLSQRDDVAARQADDVAACQEDDVTLARQEVLERNETAFPMGKKKTRRLQKKEAKQTGRTVTVGEFDILFLQDTGASSTGQLHASGKAAGGAISRTFEADANSGEVVGVEHWELSVKFLLYVGPEAKLLVGKNAGEFSDAVGRSMVLDGGRPEHPTVEEGAKVNGVLKGCEAKGQKACSVGKGDSTWEELLSAEADVTVEETGPGGGISDEEGDLLYYFVGPHAGERLSDRRDRIAKQLRLSDDPKAKEVLEGLFLSDTSQSNGCESEGHGHVSESNGSVSSINDDLGAQNGYVAMGISNGMGAHPNRSNGQERGTRARLPAKIDTNGCGSDVAQSDASSSVKFAGDAPNSLREHTPGVEPCAENRSRPEKVDVAATSGADVSSRRPGKVTVSASAFVKGYLFYEHKVWKRIVGRGSSEKIAGAAQNGEVSNVLERSTGPKPYANRNGLLNPELDPAEGVAKAAQSMGGLGLLSGISVVSDREGSACASNPDASESATSARNATDDATLARVATDGATSAIDAVDYATSASEPAAASAVPPLHSDALGAATSAPATSAPNDAREPPKGTSPLAEKAAVNPAIWVGWWTRDVEKFLGDPSFRDSRWYIIPKMEWLSPVAIRAPRQVPDRRPSDDPTPPRDHPPTPSRPPSCPLLTDRCTSTALTPAELAAANHQIDGQNPNPSTWQAINGQSSTAHVDPLVSTPGTGRLPQNLDTTNQQCALSTPRRVGAVSKETTARPEAAESVTQLLTSAELLSQLMTLREVAERCKIPRRGRVLVAEMQWQGGGLSASSDVTTSGAEGFADVTVLRHEGDSGAGKEGPSGTWVEVSRGFVVEPTWLGGSP